MKRVGLGLLLSAAVHAGALLTASSFGHDQPPATAAIAEETARIELVRIDVPGPSAPAAVDPAPAAPAPVRVARTRPRAPRAAVVTSEASPPESAPLPPATSPAASAANETGGSPDGESTTAAGSGGGVTGLSGDGSGRLGDSGHGSGFGAGELDAQQRARLHARLSEAARECYPPAARRFRLTGEVLLSFCLDGTGGFHSVQALKASGLELLDRAAVDCVLPQAAPLPGPAACLRVPVQFRQDR